MASNRPFDFEVFKRAMVSLDVDAWADCFASDAEWIEYRHANSPRSPNLMRGLTAIRAFLARVKASNIAIAITDEVLGPTRAAFCLTCTFPDGERRIIEHVIVHHVQGKIVRQVDVEAWDPEETPASSGETEYTLRLKPIGTIRTGFTDPRDMPIQPSGAAGVSGSIELRTEYAGGLKDLEGFSHLVLLYQFHRSQGYDLEVVPFLDSRSHGVFATRAPRRPNAIGLSVVRLVSIEGSILHVDGIDVLDGTPLLDIKPHVPDFDAPAEVRTGWLAEVSHEAKTKRSDDRFS